MNNNLILDIIKAIKKINDEKAYLKDELKKASTKDELNHLQKQFNDLSFNAQNIILDTMRTIDLNALFKDDVIKYLDSIPKPKDGKDGENGKDAVVDYDSLHSYLNKKFDAIEIPQAEKVDYELVKNTIKELISKFTSTIKNGKNGKDGENGKDGIGIKDIKDSKSFFEIVLDNGIKKKIVKPLDMSKPLLGGGIDFKTINGESIVGKGNIDIAGGSGGGDMLKSVYDTNNNGIVDNAEKVNGLTVETAVPADAVFTDTIYDDTAILSSLNNKIESSLIGIANGLATLDSNSKITLSQIPDSILGQLEYQGVYDFSSSLPTATQKGQYWICSVSGNGYSVGDWAVWNGTSFDKVDNTDAVSSVNGQTGNVNIVNISGNAETVTNGLYTTDIGVTVQGYNANTVIDANYVHTDNNFTTTLKNKLDGIASGAEVNVNADWNAISGDAQILNKPTTLSGYGITDVYSKTEIDTIIGDINSALDAINGEVI